jgi:hypothetical protein
MPFQSPGEYGFACLAAQNKVLETRTEIDLEPRASLLEPPVHPACAQRIRKTPRIMMAAPARRSRMYSSPNHHAP